MNDLIKKKLIDVKSDVVALSEYKRTSMSLFRKHDLVLTGSNRNSIYAVELLYMLDLSVEKHIDLIPGICEELGLKCFGTLSSNDLLSNDVEIREFTIELI